MQIGRLAKFPSSSQRQRRTGHIPDGRSAQRLARECVSQRCTIMPAAGPLPFPTPAKTKLLLCAGCEVAGDYP